MKFLNIKKLFLTAFNFAILIFSFNSFADMNCSYSGGAITNTPSSTVNSMDCVTKPDIERVVFYKAYLCTSKPGDPTTSVAIDLSSCGDPVFQSTSGAEVDIQTGLTSLLTNGEFKKPASGIYRYVYIEISPTMKVQATKTFSSTRKNTNGSSAGVVCWTITSSNYSGRTTDNNSTKCGAAADGSLGLSTDIVNTLDGSDPANRIIYSKDFTTSQGKTLSTFLLNSSNKIASGSSATDNGGTGSLGTISKIVGYAPQDVVISDSTSQIIVNYNNYQGTSVGQYWNGSNSDIRVNNFSSGPFDIYITAQ